jgi:predicted dehydrogenase
MNQVNWGIIGCGDVTEKKSGPAFNKVEGSKIIAVMRRDGEKASDYALRHNVPLWYTNADEIIDHPEINCIYIATPPVFHSDYAIRAMQKGKVVYVEKPMAADYAECLRMHEVSESTQIPLYVAYYRRFLPYFIRVKEILNSGILGNILYANIQLNNAPGMNDRHRDTLPWRVIPDIAGAGHFYDLACHQLDLMEWFFGTAREATGITYNKAGLYAAEDTVIGRIDYDSGVSVSGQWCFVCNEKEHVDLITIFGTKGSIVCSTFDFTPIKMNTGNGIEEYLPDNPEHIQYGFIRNMIEELRGLRPVKANSASAVRTNRTLDKILGKIKP